MIEKKPRERSDVYIPKVDTQESNRIYDQRKERNTGNGSDADSKFMA